MNTESMTGNLQKLVWVSTDSSDSKIKNFLLPNPRWSRPKTLTSCVHLTYSQKPKWPWSKEHRHCVWWRLHYWLHKSPFHVVSSVEFVSTDFTTNPGDNIWMSTGRYSRAFRSYVYQAIPKKRRTCVVRRFWLSSMYFPWNRDDQEQTSSSRRTSCCFLWCICSSANVMRLSDAVTIN
jgi:hypothetical protein